MVDPLLILSIFLGLIFGSFATAVAYRLPRGEQFITGRSRCPTCKHELFVLDLFPILSWAVLRGKCRYCKTEFGGGYPLIEVALSLMFAAIYIKFGVSLESLILAFFATTIIILIAIDFEHYIIPDGVNITLFIIGVIYSIFHDAGVFHFIFAPLLGLCVGLMFRWIIKFWKKREGLGLGDVKFLMSASLFLNLWLIDIFLFLAGIIGILTAVIWKIRGKGERFPFGPSLSISLFLVIIFPEISQYWQSVMLQLTSFILL